MGKWSPLVWGWPCFRCPEKVRSGILGRIWAREWLLIGSLHTILRKSAENATSLQPVFPGTPESNLFSKWPPGPRWLCSDDSSCLGIYLLSVRLVKSHPLFKVHLKWGWSTSDGDGPPSLSVSASEWVRVSLTWVSRAHCTSATCINEVHVN